MRTRLALLCAAIGCLLIACASTPNRNLERAQSEYTAAAADPQVQSYAPTALRDAWTAVSRAEQAERARQSRDEVDHLAYIASRRIEIARVMARRSALASVPLAAAPAPVYPAPVYTAPVYPSTASATPAEARVERLSAELAAALQDLRTRRGDRGVVVSVEDVLFQPGQATLHTAALADLARLADFLERHPELTVQIEGHSDGSESDALSIQRARAVESYLVMRGTEPRRITTVAQGPYEPISSNTTAAGRAQNRRVEIVLLD